MDLVRTALFGVTHPHSRHHLKTLQASSMVSGIILYDQDSEALERSGSGKKVESVYTDLEALLKEEEFLVGIACVENDLNASLCNRLIEAGIHVISEKPIGRNTEEVESVVTAAREKNLKLGVMYTNRSHPVSQEARKLVQEGVIGRVTSCEARMVTSQVKFRNPEHWLFEKERSGGGILSWLGCHHIDLLCYVMGDDITSVSGIVDTLSGEAIDVEDVASVSFRFRSGAIGGLQAGYQLAMSTEGYQGAKYDNYVGFRGTEGRVYWSPIDRPPRLHVESARQEWASAPERTFDFMLPEVEAYGGAHGLSFVETFFSSALGMGEPVATGEDALRVARILDAIYESSSTGRRIEL